MRQIWNNGSSGVTRNQAPEYPKGFRGGVKWRDRRRLEMMIRKRKEKKTGRQEGGKVWGRIDDEWTGKMYVRQAGRQRENEIC